MRFLQMVERFLFDSRQVTTGLVILVILVIKSGIWWMPNVVEAARLAQNPFVVPTGDPEGTYIVWTWLGSYLAWLLGMTSTSAFLVLHAVFALGFVGAMLLLLKKRLPPDSRRSGLVLFVALPVAGFSLICIGPDSLTLLLWTGVLALASSLIACVVLGVALGMQHFEQAILGAVLLLVSSGLAKLARHPEHFPLRSAIALAGAIALGRLLLGAIFEANGMAPVTRSALAQERFLTYLSQSLLHWQAVLWALLGVGWLVIAYRTVDEGRRALPFLTALVLAIAVVPTVADQSRVFAVVSFPLLAVNWLLRPEFVTGLTKRFTAVLFAAWAVIPFAWIWFGEPKWSVLPYDVMLLLNHFFGWFTVPDDIGNWPFF